jgi:hypothetical protein
MPKYICDDFNKLCTELGVQCCMTLNTKTYQVDYLIQNLGKRKVIVFTDEFFREVCPGMETLISMPNGDSPWMAFDEISEQGESVGQVSINGKYIYAGVSERDGKEWDVYEPLTVLG